VLLVALAVHVTGVPTRSGTPTLELMPVIVVPAATFAGRSTSWDSGLRSPSVEYAWTAK
jgi:hypothetical protein